MNFLFLNSARRGWGGNEKWTKMAAEALGASHAVMLAYRDPAIGDRIDVEKVRLPFRWEFDPATLSSLVRLVRQQKIDILIPTKRKDYVIAGLICRLTGATNILRLGIDRPLKNTLIQRLIFGTLTDGVIVNAEKIRQTLARSLWFDTGKVRVIYNGIDRERLEIDSGNAYEKPFPFMIGAAGALIPRKGFDFLIRAFARFATSNKSTTDSELVIAGAGPERESLEQLAADLEVSNRVRFTGHLSNPYPMMRACDLFVSASQSEGLANVLLESMALCCVPISTLSGGADELIEDGKNGFLVQYGDEEQLAGIFDKLFRNRDQVEPLATNAQWTIMEHFSIEQMRTDLLEFCSETLDQKQSA
ncbi:MAG TPA: glycosyltransferase [Chlorobaculum parvum]|uniref:Glycosyltransferase n=1 Tax=Chlorobaculum parvum TaxID=274539 RepID=A0A7C5DIA2_9CHLB|nr:glycosyltransferase [Chlorobaculum parvum]